MGELNLSKQSIDLKQKATPEQAAAALQAEILKLEVRAKGLEKDKAALISEYVTANDEQAPAIVKKNIRARMPIAIETLDELLATGSDSIRANLLKWVIDRGLAPDQLGGVDIATQEFSKLLESLKAND